MSEQNSDDSKPGYDRLIREAKEEAFHARRRLRREQPSPSAQTKREVAVALADYHDVLTDYRDEQALDADWGERMAVDPDVLLGRTVAVERGVPSRNRSATETVEMPAAATLSPTDLLALAKELDAIAKELGFAAKARDKTPRDEATMDDLRALLETRGQTDSADRLPDPRGGD